MSHPVRRLSCLPRPVLCFIPVAMALLLPLAARGQGDPQRPVVPFNGTEVFRFILQERGLRTPLKKPIEIYDDPAHTVLILFGDTSTLDFASDDLKDFVRKGGALLVATDRRTSPILKDAFGLEVEGSHLKSLDKDHAYLGFWECPMLLAGESFKPDLPLFHGVERIATNVPSYLEESADFDTVAHFTHIGLVNWPFDWQIQPTFAASHQEEDGRILALADQSIFINGMILRTDNNNFDFAYNCIDWLQESGPRTTVLFIEDGRIVTEFPQDLFPPVVPPIPQISPPPAAIVDNFLAGLEQENALDRMLNSVVSLRQLLCGAALLLTTGLAILGLYRLVQARHRIEVQAPLFTTSVSQLAPNLALVQLRHRAMIREGNLWETAHDLARQWFMEAGYPLTESSEQSGSRIHQVPPRIHVTGGWWRRRQFYQLAVRLWKLGVNPIPRRVGPTEFQRLVSDMDKLKNALKEGTLRIDGTIEEAG